jgi:lipoprotein-anchoring transpeptidase ErfK/SrfK
MTEDSKMIRVGGHGASVGTGRLWRIFLLMLAGAIGTAYEADAAGYYWSGYDSGYYYYLPAPTVPQRPRVRRYQTKKIEATVKETAKPQGPLIIAISIERQSLKIYDANGFFAETPISTGMRGHPTPMGVFSIIQKHKFHHSNIYSNAPMPYMQRITWSGVAMHAGVLPGYPASHGCIRMPMAFAVKMWNWTKMGARVVITPGEITPASFSHPLLAEKRAVPKPIASNEPQADAPAANTADKATGAAPKPVTAQASLELRSTLGHDDGVKPVIADQGATTSLPGQTRTAYASGDLPPAKASVTMSDAAPGAKSDPAKSEAEPPAAATESGPSEPAKPESDANATRGETTSTDDKSADVAKLKVAANENVKAEGKPDEGTKPEADTSPSAPDVKKDQAATPDNKPAAPKPDPAANAMTPKRAGQIAALISRKDSRLYVRQNFSALFDVPVTIAPSDRPLGTHVFTVRVDKDDASVLRWSVVSLPAPARYAERRDEDERALRRRKIAGAIEVRALPAANGPADALNRLTIPADAMARITEALSTGGSIIVSDQGITAGETGEGTDFIVSLR